MTAAAATRRLHQPWPERHRPRLGVVEWLRPGEHERALQLIEGMRRIGVRHLRTGVSWADWHTEDGSAWYRWLLPRLARELTLLPCVTYTPPSLGIAPKTSAPPRDPRAYADFLDLLIDELGAHFEWLELWNEPNNLNDWDWRLDPEWLRFSEMVGAAAYWARRRGKRTVLGGMCPTDPNWLFSMGQRGVLDHIDAVGLHAFPGTWQHEGESWQHLIEIVRHVLDEHGADAEIWATEVGYSTWRHDDARQIDCFLDGLAAPLERVYWYSFFDLHPDVSSQEGFHVDERHYHFGLVQADGSPKLLHRLLSQGGIDAVDRVRRLGTPAIARRRPRAVITGGAGFVGANLADRLAREGEDVLIYDSLSRPGVEANAVWLEERHGDRIALEIADVRDAYTLRNAVRRATRLFHLSAQVAVTTSLTDPALDFEINARGTLNLLEALRSLPEPPPLVFSSTNKVYGRLLGVDFEERELAYAPQPPGIEAFGIVEEQPLDFCSPYGCSKGSADQYVLDYARVFRLPVTVFRMSCTYGPRQLGTEDQGWVAHFLRRAQAGEPITIYGDGKQVRDLLFVDDLIEAMLLAQTRIADLQGRAFNIGGGPRNAVSLLEVLELIGRIAGRRPAVEFGPWRAGDQLWYVSDIRGFGAATGWAPRVDARSGIGRLWRWLQSQITPAPRLQQAKGAAA